MFEAVRSGRSDDLTVLPGKRVLKCGACEFPGMPKSEGSDADSPSGDHRRYRPDNFSQVHGGSIEPRLSGGEVLLS
jgi:hypothetical protein